MTKTTIQNSKPSGSEGAARLLIFFVFLIFVFWGINMYRHIRNGKWSLFQKIADIGGMIFFGIIIIAMIVPII